MSEQKQQARVAVAKLNSAEENSRTIAVAANSINLRLSDLGVALWGSNEAFAFLTILRALNSLNANIETTTDSGMLSPQVNEQAVNEQLEKAAAALVPKEPANEEQPAEEKKAA